MAIGGGTLPRTLDGGVKSRPPAVGTTTAREVSVDRLSRDAATLLVAASACVGNVPTVEILLEEMRWRQARNQRSERCYGCASLDRRCNIGSYCRESTNGSRVVPYNSGSAQRPGDNRKPRRAKGCAPPSDASETSFTASMGDSSSPRPYDVAKLRRTFTALNPRLIDVTPQPARRVSRVTHPQTGRCLQHVIFN
jgi:hypothetical protein